MNQRKGSLRRIGIIARREWSVTVRRREFLLITFGLPVFYLFLFFIVGVATASAVGSAEKKRENEAPHVLGFWDGSRALSSAALTATDDDYTGRVFASEASGQEAVKAKQIRALVSVPSDWAQSGAVTVYLPPARDSLFGSDKGGGTAGIPIARYLRRAFLAGKVSPRVSEQVLRPVEPDTKHWDPKAGRFAHPDPLRSIARFAVPYAMSLLLMLSVVFSSSYLVHGVVDEKENRIIEVLLSAASHSELLAGKLLGLGGAGLTQFGIWVGSGLVTGGLGRTLLPQGMNVSLTTLGITPGLLVTALALFLTGYALYAALMVSVGSLGSSWRESQQISGLMATLLVIPMLFMPVLLEEPNGALARTLSLIPFTAPIGMILRVAAGGSSAGEVLLSLVLLILTTIGAIRIAGSIFRLSLLLYGQRPTLRQVVRYLRTSG